MTPALNTVTHLMQVNLDKWQGLLHLANVLLFWYTISQDYWWDRLSFNVW